MLSALDKEMCRLSNHHEGLHYLPWLSGRAMKAINAVRSNAANNKEMEELMKAKYQASDQAL